MEFIKKLLIAAVIFAAATVQTDSFARVTRATKKLGLASKGAQIVAPVAEPVVDADIVAGTERGKIEQALIDTENIKTAATLAINAAQDQLAKGEISYVKAAQIIGEQNYKIEQAKEQLAALTKKSVDKVEDAEIQESYFNQLISGAQAAGAGLLERAGYSSTAQEKAIAQAIIDELKSTLPNLEKDYAKKIDAADNAQDKMKLSQELASIKQEIEKEIYRQQTITEEVTSTNKKLFWTAVGLAGAAVGGALAYQYLGTEAPAPSTPLTPPAVTESAPLLPTDNVSDFEPKITAPQFMVKGVEKLTTQWGDTSKKVLETEVSEQPVPSPAFVEEVGKFGQQYRDLSVKALNATDSLDQGPIASPKMVEGIQRGLKAYDEKLRPVLERQRELEGLNNFEGSAGPLGQEVQENIRGFLETNLPASASQSQSKTLWEGVEPSDESNLDPYTLRAREAIQAGVESGIGEVQKFVGQYEQLSTKALENPEDFNQQPTVPQEIIEKIREELSQIPGETEADYLKRLAEAQKERERMLTEQWSKQPSTKLPAEKQPTLADIGQQLSEAGQAARKKAEELGRTFMKANIVPGGDLQSPELSDEAAQQYRESVIEPAARKVGEGIADTLRRAAEVREEYEPVE